MDATPTDSSGQPPAPTTMRAAVVRRYGPPEVVEMVDVAVPVPTADQVLVRVRSVSVTSADARIRAARFPRGFGLPARLAFGIRRPRRRVLGSAFAGEVVAVGARVASVAPGDRVCGMTGIALGAHATFVAAPASKVTAVPAGVSFDDAAGVLFGGSTALHFLLTKASITTGTTVLVNGASGAIGTNAVQIAADLGARVTAVCSGANAALVTGLGAADVIDHTVRDLGSVTGRFDVVLDTVGNLSVTGGTRLLTDDGVLLLAVADLVQTLRARGRVRAGTSPESVDLFDELVTRVSDGRLRVVIDCALPLEDIVEAHRRVDTGHKRGNLVVHP